MDRRASGIRSGLPLAQAPLSLLASPHKAGYPESMATGPEHILASPERSVAVGSKPMVQRRSWGWMEKAATAVLFSAAAFAAQAHGPAEVGHTHTPPVIEATQTKAPTTQSARVSSNVLLDKASRGEVSWMSAQGQVNAADMLEQWRAGGVSVEQAFEMMSVLMLTQSPVIARTQGALEHAEKVSLSTRDIAEVRSARNAEFFLRRHGLDALVEDGRISPVEAVNVQSGEGMGWDQALDYWKVMARQRHADPLQTPVESTPQELASAQQALASAVNQVGLASVRIPLAAWGSSPALNTLAERLVKANATLEKITGWSGQVLGLNGRLAITPFSPSDNAFAYVAPDKTLRLDGQWEDIPHEWVHVLDSVLRTAAVDTQVMGGASLSHQVFTQGSTDAIGQAWKNASASWSTSETVGDWMARRQIMLKGLAEGSSEDQAKALYFGSANEMMGYAWGAYVQSQVPKDSVFHDARQAERMAYDGEHGPTVAQASGMKKDWQALFQTVGQQWWAQQAAPAASMPSLAQWRQGREQPPAPKATPLAMAF